MYTIPSSIGNAAFPQGHRSVFTAISCHLGSGSPFSAEGSLSAHTDQRRAHASSLGFWADLVAKFGGGFVLLIFFFLFPFLFSSVVFVSLFHFLSFRLLGGIFACEMGYHLGGRTYGVQPTHDSNLLGDNGSEQSLDLSPWGLGIYPYSVNYAKQERAAQNLDIHPPADSRRQFPPSDAGFPHCSGTAQGGSSVWEPKTEQERASHRTDGQPRRCMPKPGYRLLISPARSPCRLERKAARKRRLVLAPTATPSPDLFFFSFSILRSFQAFCDTCTAIFAEHGLHNHLRRHWGFICFAPALFPTYFSPSITAFRQHPLGRLGSFMRGASCALLAARRHQKKMRDPNDVYNRGRPGGVWLCASSGSGLRWPPLGLLTVVRLG